MITCRKPLKTITVITLLSLFVLMIVTSTSFAQPTKLTLQVDNRPNYVAWIEAVIAAFERDNPDIQVELWVPSGNLTETLFVSFAAGTPPDIGLHDPHVVIDFARQSLLEDLFPYIEREPDQFSTWLPPATQIAKFREGLYALPRDLQVYGIYYNEDAYASAGMGSPPEDWTWADLRDTARNLYRTDGQGVAIQNGFRLPSWRAWVVPIWGHGGDFLDSWTNPTRFTGRSEGVIKGFEYIHDLIDSKAILDKEEDKRWGINASFMEQRVAMIAASTFTNHAFRDIEGFTWNVTSLPVDYTGEHRGAISALGWFMTSASPNKEQAWALLKYITSPKALDMLVEMVGVFPPDRNIAVEKWIGSADFPRDKHLFLNGLENPTPPMGALNASVYAPLAEEGLAAIWSDKPVSAAIDNMEQLINAAMIDMQD